MKCCSNCRFGTYYPDAYVYCGKLESPKYSLILDEDDSCKEWKSTCLCGSCKQVRVTNEGEWEVYACDYMTNVDPSDEACEHFEKEDKDGLL